MLIIRYQIMHFNGISANKKLNDEITARPPHTHCGDHGVRAFTYNNPVQRRLTKNVLGNT